MRRAEVVVERDEEVGRAHVPVVLRHLVLEDQVVAERVPGQLASQAVVLVQVARWWVKTTSGEKSPLKALEELLDLAAVVGEEAVGEVADHHALRDHAVEQGLGARLRLGGSLARAAQHDPADLGDRALLDQLAGSCRRSRSRCRPDGRRARARGRARASGRPSSSGSIRRAPLLRHGRRCEPSRSHSCHGALPLSWRPSRHCLSLSVSIGAQKPSWRWASTWPVGHQAR